MSTFIFINCADENEQLSRIRFIEESRSWINTPYRLGAQVKGGGVDCCRFPYAVLMAMKMIPSEHIGVFKGDWWCHVKEEIYVKRMLRHAVKVAESICAISTIAEPGNIMLGRVAGSHFYNHAAIITQWPMGIEAIAPFVHEANLPISPMWAFKDITIFDPFNKPNEKEKL